MLAAGPASREGPSPAADPLGEVAREVRERKRINALNARWGGTCERPRDPFRRRRFATTVNDACPDGRRYGLGLGGLGSEIPPRPRTTPSSRMHAIPSTDSRTLVRSASRSELPLDQFEDEAAITAGSDTGREQAYLRRGGFRFEIDGEEVAVHAYESDPAAHCPWIPFRDHTSGNESEGAGTYRIEDRHGSDRRRVDVTRGPPIPRRRPRTGSTFPSKMPDVPGDFSLQANDLSSPEATRR